MNAAPLAILNLEFLEAMFLDLPDDASAAVCGFSGDPNAPPEFAWAAREWRHGMRLPYTITTITNNYVTVSSFRPDSQGKVRRRKDQFARLHAVMIDDINTKVAPARLRLPMSADIETSPSNRQGYYFIEPSAGSDERATAERLIEQLVAAGLTTDGKDPGMKGVTRYGRLPVGTNGKRKYVEQLGLSFPCRLLTWKPDRRYPVEQLAQVYQLDLTPRPRAPVIPITAAQARRGADSFGALLETLALMNMYRDRIGNGPWHAIRCPWVHEHTDGAQTGTAIADPSSENNFAGGFQCHHGHCEDRTMRDMWRWVKDLSRELDRMGRA